MTRYNFDFAEYNRKFKAQSSEKLVKDYLGYNADYRKIARLVLKKRGDLLMLNKHLALFGRKPIGKARIINKPIWEQFG